MDELAAARLLEGDVHCWPTNHEAAVRVEQALRAVRPTRRCAALTVQRPDIKTSQKAFTTRQGGHVTLNDVIVACLADAVRPSIDAGQPRPGTFRSLVRRIAPLRVSFFIPISHRRAWLRLTRLAQTCS